jgi:regulator of sirC expression with transglutaminase-like and TPR domain
MDLNAVGLVDDGDIDLIEAAVALSLADKPGGDAARLRRLVTGWAIALQRDAAPVSASARARRLAALISSEAGITGATEDYDDADNCDVIAVIERQRGLPVALALLYVALARRVGWKADVLKIARHAGGEPQLPFAAMNNRHILIRLVTNQASRARASGDIRRALTLYERMTSVSPRMASLWWERARLEQLLGLNTAARASLTAMLETTHDQSLTRRIKAALAALARSES